MPSYLWVEIAHKIVGLNETALLTTENAKIHFKMFLLSHTQIIVSHTTLFMLMLFIIVLIR